MGKLQRKLEREQQQKAKKAGVLCLACKAMVAEWLQVPFLQPSPPQQIVRPDGKQPGPSVGMLLACPACGNIIFGGGIAGTSKNLESNHEAKA